MGTIQVALLTTLVAAALAVGLPPAFAQGVPGGSPNKCLSGKTKCVNKKVAGLLKCREKCQKDPASCGAAQTACEDKVIAKFDGGTKGTGASCFGKLEARQDPSAPETICTTTGDLAPMEGMADTMVAGLVGTLEGRPPPACQAFPATGQTTCWNSAGEVIPCAGTGHDGDIQAGATLAYIDNGDGTITDVNTGLMWEKLSDDGSIHDKDTLSTWDDAYAVHMATLNGDAGFAGHKDWRVPNVKELSSIVNYQNIAPAVSPAFNKGCASGCSVLTCSCTVSSSYWSSSTKANSLDSAWYVFFVDGAVGNDFKGNGNYVRAVRGGS